LDSKDAKPCKPRMATCDASYCSRITREWVEEQRLRDLQKWDSVLELI
jgi:hypothetical protein